MINIHRDNWKKNLHDKDDALAFARATMLVRETTSKTSTTQGKRENFEKTTTQGKDERREYSGVKT
jgi:hypothetical protein